MKICFVYNEKNDKYAKLAKEIYGYFEINDEKVQTCNILDEKGLVKENDEIKDNKKLKTYKTLKDFYIFFSDSAEELKENYDRVKRPKRAMIITENLTVEYIMLCVDIGKNICYSKKEISEICSRIEAVYEKYMEE